MNRRDPSRGGNARSTGVALAVALVMAFFGVLVLGPGRAVAVNAVAVDKDRPTPASRILIAQAEHAQGEQREGAHQGEAHETPGTPDVDMKKLALQLLNFGVLLFILIKFGGGAINKALAARHHQLKTDLAAAAELRSAAEAKLARQELRLASIETEIAEMRRGLRAEAAMEKEHLIAAAEERARRIKAETSFLVEQQVREAEVRLRRESADTALKVAEDILRRSIGAADHQRLLDTFVGDVEQATPTVPRRSV